SGAFRIEDAQLAEDQLGELAVAIDARMNAAIFEPGQQVFLPGLCLAPVLPVIDQGKVALRGQVADHLRVGRQVGAAARVLDIDGVGRVQQGNGPGRLNLVDDGGEVLAEGVPAGRSRRAVVHAEHDRDDIRLEAEHTPVEVSQQPTRAVAADPRVDDDV